MFELFQKGGFIMYPLLICSVISVAFSLERLFFWMREKRALNSKLLNSIMKEAENGNYHEALELGKGSKDHIVRVICNGLAHIEFSMINALELAAGDEINRMRRGLGVLDTIITMAPLLGILGTVIGIIQSFDMLGEMGIEDPKSVTGGIAQALITTAAGLTIALFTIIPYNYFVSCVEKATRNMEKYITSLEILYQKRTNAK
ncbi:MAG: MotA/TolQ/ExbB proton channel family protein [Candidatus Kuenenia sp.]|nr:MotA/TolQ/ExbB proton channel family protein [Candidatus Kuenenia hertensis]